MPEKLEECVDSVLEDDPSKSESDAYAICNAQLDDASKQAHDETFEDAEAARERAQELGLDDVHWHDVDGETVWMPGKDMSELRDAVDSATIDQQAEFTEGDAVTWSWDGESVHGRVARVVDQYTPPEASEPITGEEGEDVYVIDEYDDDVQAYRRENVGKPESSLDESQRDLPPRTDDNYAALAAHSEWTVRELDAIAAEMDVLSRATPAGDTVVWRSADQAITYFAELPDKYADEIGEDAFVPPDTAADNARKALEWYEEHEDEFDAGAEDGEGIRRARQIVEHYENDEPLAPEYVVEIQGYLARSDAQEGRAELDDDVPDDQPWLDDGYTAHLLWGGDAMLDWAEDLVAEMEDVDSETEQEAVAGATTAEGWQADGPAAAVTQASVAADDLDAPGPLRNSITKEGSNEIDVESLPEEYQAALEADDFLVYGKASIEQYDRSDDPIKIEMEALEDALDRFFESQEAPGIISLYHDDIPVGVPVREHVLDEDTTIHLESPDGEPERYEFEAGEKLTTHVEDGDGDGRPEMWLLSNLAGDSEMAKEVRLRALQGELNGYSVTIHRNRDEQTDTGRLVTQCDLHAVTLGTSEIVKNAGSTFGVAEYQAFSQPSAAD